MFFILILVHLLFIYFFWKINFIYGIYIVGFFLSIFIILIFFSDNGKNSGKELLKRFFITYLMYINFIIIQIGFYFIINYFLQQQYGINTLTSLKSIFFIIGGTTIISILGIIFDKKNLIKSAYFGLLLLWCYVYYITKNINIFEYFIGFILSLSFTSHLIYLTKFGKYNKFLLYLSFLSGFVIFFIIINNFFIGSSILLSLIIQIVIGLILSLIIYIKNSYEKYIEVEKKLKEKQHEMSLFGYSDIKLKDDELKLLKKINIERLKLFLDFFLNSPFLVKLIFSLINTIPVFYATYYFIINVGKQGHNINSEILYWTGAIIFFINFILFKKINWFVSLQRIVAFFVVNFGIYYTIIDIFGKTYLYISIGGILWNLFATSIILFIGKKNSIFHHIDYIIWSLINFLGVGLNIYFLLKIGLDNYLSFGIILLYLGFYLYLARIIYKKIFL